MSQILTRTLPSDHITPVRAYAALRAQSPGRSSFLFESAQPGERWGRYSILGYRARSEQVYPPGTPAFAMLAEDASALENPEGMAAQMSQALVGFLAYDAAHLPNGIPLWPNEGMLARLMRDQTVVVFDHVAQTMTLAGRSKGALDRCQWEMTHGPDFDALPLPDPAAEALFAEPSMSDDAFGVKVEKAKQYILAGDCLQIVLSRTFRAPMRNADAFDVYRALRVLSPSPYLYFLEFGETPFAEGLQIAGASPETLVRVAGGKVTLRPIAGTRRRGATAEEDELLAKELLADPKERAEHVMLVDLARNDVGRVAAPGSVRVTKEMEVERYSHVMHLVSEVTGDLAEDKTPLDAAKAAFPAGTLSGAPKVMAMQIIRKLEPGSRGVYGGGIGYILPNGTVDMAIGIRTVLAQRSEFEVTAGAGIVADSDPQKEADETRNKARAALAAVRAAQDAAERREKREEEKRKKAEEDERKKAAEAEAGAEAGAAAGAEAGAAAGAAAAAAAEATEPAS